MALTFMTMTIDDIMEWCEANGHKDWLKKLAASTTKCEVYPKKRVPKLNEDGTPVLNKKGRPVMVAVADYSQEPIVEERPITFIEIKQAFVEEFMPELAPKKKDDKPNMYERIAKW